MRGSLDRSRDLHDDVDSLTGRQNRGIVGQYRQTPNDRRLRLTGSSRETPLSEPSFAKGTFAMGGRPIRDGHKSYARNRGPELERDGASGCPGTHHPDTDWITAGLSFTQCSVHHH